LRDFCKQRNLEFHSISAATGDGVKELVRSIADALDKIPRPFPEATEFPEGPGHPVESAESSQPGPTSGKNS
jgi:hypothetical protein